MTEIAIGHKDYDVRGGGEVLAEHLARAFDAPLVVGHGNPDNQPGDNTLDIRELAPDSWLHRLAASGGAPRALAHMLLWRDHAPAALNQADTVILSGNEPIWWTPTRDDQTVISYTHSTPWFQTNRFDEIDGLVGRSLEQLKRWLLEAELYEPDLWVANSELVARRMQRYWRVNDDDIRVVHPPVNTRGLGPEVAPTGDYYLSLSRLDPVKHVDKIIMAANRLELPLKVAGTGQQADELRELAGPTVDLVGWVDGDAKAELFSGARATLTACSQEDFGIVNVESIASGTPVIGPKAGFVQHQIQDGKNGLLYNDRLADAIRRFEREGVAWSPAQLADWARQNFGVSRFEQAMRDVVAVARDRAAVKPGFEPPRQEAPADD